MQPTKMPPLSEILAFLTPYEWQPLVTLAVGGALVLYLRGIAAGARPGFWRSAAFFIGLALMYLVSQTQYDYYAQYVFFIHRRQHLVLHHLAAMLIVLANPLPVLAADAGAAARTAGAAAVADAAGAVDLPGPAVPPGSGLAVRRPDLFLADSGNPFRRHAQP
ncbi:MAG: cytochrome c oxidase assembly protein [Arhodomonas sp.]|nr:cytochrome c oxidase assembly protein [Arhodomonas sp.]